MKARREKWNENETNGYVYKVLRLWVCSSKTSSFLFASPPPLDTLSMGTMNQS